MKKTIAFICIISVLCLSAPAAFAAAPGNSAGAAILVHADSGQVLFSQNADNQMLIASTTKIMTALVVLENCDPDEKVDILNEYAAVEGSSMYLKPGGEYTVRDLLYGMMLASGNDAATALACHAGGSIEGFAGMMNAKASELGLKNTSFENPHGLDGKQQYSSAYDLAMITCKALENELFAQIVATKTYSVGEQSYMNHNKLLWSYEGCRGVKTGYTIAAGRTLVSCAERDGMKLVCVTLSDPNDWKDHAALFDWGFSAFAYRSVLPMGDIYKVPVISGTVSEVGVTASENPRFLCEADDKVDFSLELPKFVYAGVQQGEVAGKVIITINGNPAGESQLIYTESVPLKDGVKLTAWERFFRAWYLSNKYSFVLGGKA